MKTTSHLLLNPPSEYKTVIVKKVFFDLKTFGGGILLLWVGGTISIYSFQEIVNGSFTFALTLLLGVLIAFIGLSLFVQLFSKRDMQISIRKDDDEILDELIAYEAALKGVTRLSITKETLENQKVAQFLHHEYQNSILKVIVDVETMIVKLDKTRSMIDLLQSKPLAKIDYADLLTCFEWQFKRMKILMRDDFTCKLCRGISVNNHVHHTYYLQHRLPWEIDDSALETLCAECHDKVHETKDIPINALAANGSVFTINRVDSSCSKCGGNGYLPQYSHVNGGVCFSCGGHLPKNATFQLPLSNLLNGKTDYDVNIARSSYRKHFGI